jgi:Type I restriction modification DNA specificity domain
MPEGWIETTFGEIATWSSGKSLPEADRVPKGSFPVMGANGEIARTERQLFTEPVITVGRVGACGEVHVIREPCWVSDNALVAQPREVVELGYLAIALEAFDFGTIVGGTTQPLITQTKLKAQAVTLPPLSEQRRIVDLIGACDVVVEAVQYVLRAAMVLATQVREDALEQIENRNPLVPLGSLLERERRPIDVLLSNSYAQIGVRSHGKGIFHKDPVLGISLGSKKIFAIEPGDLVFNIVFAWEGAVAVARQAEHGMCGSHRFPTYRPSGPLPVDFFRHFFSSPKGRNLLQLASPGSAGRNRTLNQKMLMDFKVPAPSQEEAKDLIETMKRAEDLVEAAAAYAKAATVARNGLLESLLSGSHSIPPSYDELLPMAS